MISGFGRIFAGWVLLSVALASASPADIGDDLTQLLSAEVPGIAAAAYLQGEVVAAGVAGHRKVGSLEKVTLEDRFHLGSCTKSMTATLAAILVKEGEISWSTTCGEAFGEMKMNSAFRKVTLKELLTNTGGLPTDVPSQLWQKLEQSSKSGPEQRLDLIREMLSKPPSYKPGKGYAYSNAGFSVAGAMLERRMGRNYQDLIREKLFAPLGMDSVHFGAPASPGLVDQPYGHVVRDGVLVSINPLPAGDNPPAITPAGRVNATILDFLKFAVLHLGNTPVAPVDSTQLKVLHTPTTSGPAYAMGWALEPRAWAGGTAFTHTGTNTMFYAVMWIAPNRDFAAVAACNSGSGFAACDGAIELLVRRYLLEE